MTLQEFYDMAGGSYADAKTRLMTDKMIARFIPKYLKDPTYAELLSAVETGDIPLAFRAAHTLKGVAGNLAFTELQAAASNLTEQLRPQTDAPDPQKVEAVKACNDRVVAALNAYLAEA